MTAYLVVTLLLLGIALGGVVLNRVVQPSLGPSGPPVRQIAGITLPHPEEDTWRASHHRNDGSPSGVLWLVHGNIAFVAEYALEPGHPIWVGDCALRPKPLEGATLSWRDSWRANRYRRQVYVGHLQRVALGESPDPLLLSPEPGGTE